MHILIVGQVSSGFYFGLINRIPWISLHHIVRASTPIVDENPTEYLSEYDIIILLAYSYHKKGEADKILTNYAQNGGAVLLDTMNSLDANGSILGVKSYTTESSGQVKISILKQVPVFSFINFQKFSPANKDAPWRYTAYKNVPIPILSTDDKIILGLKEIGSGRAVYLGFNLFHHAMRHQNLNELRFLARLVEWAPIGS